MNMITRQRIVLVMIVWLISRIGSTQTCDTTARWFPGAVVTRVEKRSALVGDTMTGCIELMDPSEMYAGPKFIARYDKHERFYGRYALAYWYVRESDTILYLNSGRDLHNYRWIYLERLVSGPMELYRFNVHGLAFAFQITSYDYYYLRVNGHWLDSRPIVWNERGKRKRLMRIFSSCPAVLEQIATTKDMDLPDRTLDFVRLYNTTCADTTP